MGTKSVNIKTNNLAKNFESESVNQLLGQSKNLRLFIIYSKKKHFPSQNDNSHMKHDKYFWASYIVQSIFCLIGFSYSLQVCALTKSEKFKSQSTWWPLLYSGQPLRLQMFLQVSNNKNVIKKEKKK